MGGPSHEHANGQSLLGSFDSVPPRLLAYSPPCLSQEHGIAFVENRGQWDGAFSHRARFWPMTVFVQERGWTFTLVEQDRGVAVRMNFGGRAGPATLIPRERLPGRHNYFLGNVNRPGIPGGSIP